MHELTNRHNDKGEAKCTMFPPFTDIPTIHSLYLQSHATAHATTHIKADDKVNTALDSKVKREEVWERKFSTVIYFENKLKNVTDTIDLTVQNLQKVKKKKKKKKKKQTLSKRKKMTHGCLI